EELNRKQNELLEKERSLADKEARLKNLEGLLKERDDLLNNITATLKKALTDFQNDEVKIEVKNGKIYISMMDKLLFKSGSSNVEPRGVDALSKLAPILKNNNDVDIVIEGHTDNIPIKTAVFKDNWDLSTYRATSVLRILLDNKVDVKKIN